MLIHRIAEQVKVRGNGYAPDIWHEWAKSRWIGCKDLTLPDGRTITVPKSSANLDVSEFNEYMTAVEVWAGEQGVYLDALEGMV